MLMVGGALPALAEHQRRPESAPPERVCEWEYDKHLWQVYGFEQWIYACEDENGDWYVDALWTPEEGYLI
jgi:hypothetical protein